MVESYHLLASTLITFSSSLCVASVVSVPLR